MSGVAAPSGLRFVHWRDRIAAYTHVANSPVNSLVVPTMESEPSRRPPYPGNSGS